jgi:hypothetical protein
VTPYAPRCRRPPPARITLNVAVHGTRKTGVQRLGQRRQDRAPDSRSNGGRGGDSIVRPRPRARSPRKRQVTGRRGVSHRGSNAKVAAISCTDFPAEGRQDIVEATPSGVACQDEAGRLWDVLWLLRSSSRILPRNLLDFPSFSYYPILPILPPPKSTACGRNCALREGGGSPLR